MPRSRSIVALALAVALVPLPGHAAPAPKPAQPATTSAPTTAPTSTPAPTTGTTATPLAPTDAGAPPTDAGAPVEGAPVEGGTPPEGETPPDAVPVEEVKEPEPPPPETPAVSEGPERPPEPTLGNGKYKAKGTGLMISGGILLGLGIVGVITTAFLTRCDELDNSFGCKNRQHRTFAIPATATVTLLGAVLLAVGLGYRARYKRWERWTPTKTAFQPVVTGDGIGVKF